MTDKSEQGTRKSRLTRLAMIIAILVVAAGALGVALVFSSSFGISQVAGNARSLHWTNATIGSSGIMRASVAQAVFFSFDERLGVSSIEARDAAVAEARANLGDVISMTTSPDAPDDPALLTALGSYLGTAEQILDLASEGRPDAAEELRLDEFEPAFEELSTELEGRQTALADSIAASEQTNGKIARLTQLAITLLIPGVAMVVFWLLLRRRLARREIELRARLEAEREVSRAKDDFVAGLSHELRTPLTTIVGFSELLLTGATEPEEEHEMLSIINSGASDLSRMVDDLLIAARIDAGALTYSPERIDLSSQIKLVVAPYLRAGEAIAVDVPSMDIYADALLVRQILHNLVSNARRHGGEKVLIRGHSDGSRAMVVVADDGPGVPPHVEERMFQRFVNRGHEAVVAGSVGLGLAISQEIARTLGASIRYKRVDGWTTFTVRFKGLPRTGDTRQELEPSQASR